MHFRRRSTHALRGRLAAGVIALAVVMAVQSDPVLAQAPVCTATQTVFQPTAGNGSKTDAAQPFSFTVPADVASITITAAGAQGGFGSSTVAPGAVVAATVTVAPGSTLCAIAGIRGGDGGSVGGGGGASFVYAISSGTCASNLPALSTGNAAPNLLVAAGGGGGSGC